MEMDKKGLGYWVSIEKLESIRDWCTGPAREDINEILQGSPYGMLIPMENHSIGPSKTIEGYRMVEHVAKGNLSVMYQNGLVLRHASAEESILKLYATNNVYDPAPLVYGYKTQLVSENFTVGDFWPTGDDANAFVRIHPLLVYALEQIRSTLDGARITVLSGYRRPDYNRIFGSVPDSTHVYGLAADIRAEGVSTARLRWVCEKVIGDKGGVGVYYEDEYVHVDTRGYRVRWDN